MSGSKSDFVLDDDLDEDEEILQIHSDQLPKPVVEPTNSNDNPIPELPRNKVQASDENVNGSTEPEASREVEKNPSPEPGSTSTREETSAPRMKAAQPTAVIVDGLPLSATRADLDSLLGASTSAITNVRLRRLEQYGLLRVRVQFKNENIAAKALEKDGEKFNERFVSIKPASYERWDAAATTVNNPRTRSPAQTGSVHRSSSSSSRQGKTPEALPDLTSVSKTFWSAFGAARQTAEKIEKRARELGQKLEHQLQVNEKVEAGKARIQEINRDLNVSGKVSEFAQAGRETAMAVDEKLHISDGVNHVVEGVGEAARKVAREVDENLRLSDKARDATNAALSSPNVGGVARKLVSRIDGATSTSKKNYQPQKLDLDETDGAINTGGGTTDTGTSMVVAEDHSVENEALRDSHEASGASENGSNNSKLEHLS